MADGIANTTEEARFVKQSRNFDIQRVIVKIGSSLLTNNGRGLDRTAIYEWAKQIAKLHKKVLKCCWYRQVPLLKVWYVWTLRNALKTGSITSLRFYWPNGTD